MSTLICEVSKIKNIIPHPNADRLEIAEVKGWSCIVPKGRYKKGDTIVYIPIDAMLPYELANNLGVWRYLTNHKKDMNGNPVAGRVRTCTLRGVISQGLVIDNPNPQWKVGKDVTKELGIFKYEMPVKDKKRDAAKSHPDFHIYTHIERWQNFPDVLVGGEEVVISEKIHGTNARFCKVKTTSLFKNLVGIFIKNFGEDLLVGSHTVNLKRGKNKYWIIALKECLNRKLKIGEIVYGELFGEGIQKLTYERSGQDIQYFDVKVNGSYLSYDDYVKFCAERDLKTVPILYKGPFSIEKMKELARGKSTLADHIKEGVVIRPVIERFDEKLGRVILKYISPEYDAWKAGREDETGEEEFDLNSH